MTTRGGPHAPIPHCAPGVWPEGIPSARFAAHVQQAMTPTCRVAILGLADDLGVRLNGGRVGAKGGPTAFRAALARYGVAQPDGFSWPHVFDAGDVIPAHGDDAAALAETHRRVTEAARELVHRGLFPIAIGGGHDLTFAFVRGVMEGVAERESAAGRPVPSWSGLYFDPHLDVRETPGSGMAFRALVERCGVLALVNVGFGPLVNSREHAAWFREHGGAFAQFGAHEVGPSENPAQVSGASQNGAPHAWFCSFDLDVLDMSVAPGVSAPNPCGVDVGTAAIAIARIAGHPSLRCLDFMELNPFHDEQGRTARVAAHLFLRALAARTGP
jgi:arginase family enzyme